MVSAPAAAPERPLALATMVLELPRGYGRVVRTIRGRPLRMVEEKDATDAERAIREVNAGLYCAEAEFLWRALGRVGAPTPRASST